MQLDYNFKPYYPKWEKGSNGLPITSFIADYVEITLYKQSVCYKVNELFESTFELLVPKKLNPEIAYKIKEYLTDKENHFVGILDSNWHELADEYWGRNR